MDFNCGDRETNFCFLPMLQRNFLCGRIYHLDIYTSQKEGVLAIKTLYVFKGLSRHFLTLLFLIVLCGMPINLILFCCQRQTWLLPRVLNVKLEFKAICSFKERRLQTIVLRQSQLRTQCVDMKTSLLNLPSSNK